VGGRRGRHPRIGRELLKVENEDQVVYVVEKLVNWVYRRAWSGRLLSEQLDDIQFEKFRQEILHEVSEKIVRV
jgi:dissimilatory sulfite reductase (desulfoviridin) alpha/beta subunit